MQTPALISTACGPACRSGCASSRSLSLRRSGAAQSQDRTGAAGLVWRGWRRTVVRSAVLGSTLHDYCLDGLVVRASGILARRPMRRPRCPACPEVYALISSDSSTATGRGAGEASRCRGYQLDRLRLWYVDATTTTAVERVCRVPSPCPPPMHPPIHPCLWPYLPGHPAGPLTTVSACFRRSCTAQRTYVHGGVNLAAKKSCAAVVIFSCLSAPAANIRALYRGQPNGARATACAACLIHGRAVSRRAPCHVTAAWAIESDIGRSDDMRPALRRPLLYGD